MPGSVSRSVQESARQRVLDIIEREPGLSISEIARRASLFWTSVALHVAALERAGIVASLRIGRRRVLLPRVLVEDARVWGAGLLGEPSCRRVARAVVDHPDHRVWELAALTGMSERAVYHHVKRLVDAGLLRTDHERAYRGLRATAALVALLQVHIR